MSALQRTLPAGVVKGPDFLCVGAQRSGTTWLYAVLERHPGVWLPPIKELHYFDEPARNSRVTAHLRNRLSSTLRGRRPMPAWDMRYFLGRRSDAWYCDLFAPGQARGLVTGEITPAYATLDEPTLAGIRSLNRAMKVIYLMRDPVERTWSAVMNRFKKDGHRDPPDLDTAVTLATQATMLNRSSYAAAIARLERVWPREQVCYEFFEDIPANPAALVTRVLTFLGVPVADVDRLIPNAAVNVAAGGRRPPPGFEQAVARRLLPDLRQLCERFDGPPRQWLARCERFQ